MNIADILLFTVNSIMPLILLILLGYFLKTKGFFSDGFLATGNKLVFYVLLPVLLFKNISDIEDISEIPMDVVGYMVVIIIVLLLFGWLMTLFIHDPKQKGVIHQCIFRSNFALIGVPLAELIGGSAGVRVAALLSLFSIPMFNIAGVIVLSVYRGGNVKVDKKKMFLDILKNPLIIGVLAGFLFVLIKLPLAGTGFYAAASKISFMGTAIGFVSKSATPVALIVLGGRFDFKRIAGYKKELTIGIVGRNIVAPLIGVGSAAVLKLMCVVDFGPEVFAALIALFGTPVAVASAIMAEAMDNDGKLAGQLVVWTSLASIVSLFVIIAVSRGLGVL